MLFSNPCAVLVVCRESRFVEKQKNLQNRLQHALLHYGEDGEAPPETAATRPAPLH